VSRDLGLLLLRTLGLGLALAHGWGKVAGLSSGNTRFIQGLAEMGFPLPGVFGWAAALAEFAGGLCVAFGVFTRVAAGFAAFTMAVAAFARHRAHLHLLVALGLMPATPEQLRAWGNPELALVYLAGFLAIAALGPGRFSIEGARGRRG
jgi:putative oxidoreductase